MNNNEKLYDAFTEIREDFIEEAKSHDFHQFKPSVYRFMPMVAALILFVAGAGGVGLWLHNNAEMPEENTSVTTTTVGATVPGHPHTTTPVAIATTPEITTVGAGSARLHTTTATTITTARTPFPTAVTTATPPPQIHDVTTVAPATQVSYTASRPGTISFMTITTTAWLSTTNFPSQSISTTLDLDTGVRPNMSGRPQFIQNLTEADIVEMALEAIERRKSRIPPFVYYTKEQFHRVPDFYYPDDFGVPLFFETWFNVGSANTLEESRKVIDDAFGSPGMGVKPKDDLIEFIGENDLYYTYRLTPTMPGYNATRFIVYKDDKINYDFHNAKVIIRDPSDMKTVQRFLDIQAICHASVLAYRYIEDTGSRYIYRSYIVDEHGETAVLIAGDSTQIDKKTGELIWWGGYDDWCWRVALP